MRSSAKKTVIEKGRFWIFVWVAAVNALMILLGCTVAAVGYRSWSFFLCNILYFAMPARTSGSRCAGARSAA